MNCSPKTEYSGGWLPANWFSAVAALLLGLQGLSAQAPESPEGNRGLFELPAVTPPRPPLGKPLPLGLKDAVALTLRKNQNILIARDQVLMARGQLQQAAGPFDPLTSAQIQGYSTKNKSDDTEIRTALARVLGRTIETQSAYSNLENTVSADASIQTLLRNGVTITPQANYSGQVEDYPGETYGDDSGTLGLSLEIPLLQGLGPNNQFAASERAAGFNLKAAKANLDFVVSQQIYNTVSAYWNLLLAQTNVRIALSQEEGARRLVGITEALIKGYVQPAAQLAQAKANLEQYSSQRISAELQQSTASQQLGVAMGFTPEELLAEPLAVTAFPKPSTTHLFDINDARPLIDLALNLRPDIQSGLESVTANKILLAGAKNAALPTLDLILGGGYQVARITQTTRTSTSKDSQGGWFVGGGVSMAYPIFNNAAEGQVVQQQSQLRQSQTQVSLTETQVASDVITALKSVILTRKSLDEAIASAQNERTSVKAQEELFSMGMASLVEVITTQNNLATAELSVATNLSNHATSLAALRFATGTLTPDSMATTFDTIPGYQRK
jgi:outer membrane protein TolC